jgi:SAM-dependent methyltransferase
MEQALKEESEKLARSWMQHDAVRLRDYLVAGVEDPRWNLQSIFSRHFLIRALSGERFAGLMEEEYRFAAVMNWLLRWQRNLGHPEEVALVAYALGRSADNVEGIEIPRFLVQTFGRLPMEVDSFEVPNYIAQFLAAAASRAGQVEIDGASGNAFQSLWPAALSGLGLESKPSVLEPACGSANDYRFVRSYGIARWLDYTGIDLCEKNIENARSLFPDVRFQVGNVFEIAAADKSVDWLYVHDLFEHLSAAGLQRAVAEVCRVTRRGLCLGFFNMDEVPEHIMQPLDEYHWNVLSVAQMKEAFAGQGFATQVLHAGSFLRQRIGCEFTHNPNAYTLVLRAFGGA